MGLSLAVKMRLSSIEVEANSLSLIKTLKSSDVARSNVGLTCEDIKELLSWAEVFLIEFVHKKGNEVAHRLAQLGLSLHSEHRRIDLTSNIIFNVLLNDLS